MIVSTVILAAGQGTRMRSELPKVLHPLAGRPLVEYSLRLAAGVSAELPVVVVGYGADAVRQVVGERARFAVQVRQLGTAHALLSAESLLAGQADLVLVISADMPLFRHETLQRLVDTQANNPGPLSMLTVVQEDSHGFGRIVRWDDGTVLSIVEEAHATPQQLAIKEVNVGAYCFSSAWLWPALQRIPVSPKGEYYLTDSVGLAVQAGLNVEALVLDDPDEAIGINTRVHLAEAEAILRKRINTGWMLEGVTIVDPASTYIEPGVRIGADTTVVDGMELLGKPKDRAEAAAMLVRLRGHAPHLSEHRDGSRDHADVERGLAQFAGGDPARQYGLHAAVQPVKQRTKDADDDERRQRRAGCTPTDCRAEGALVGVVEAARFVAFLRETLHHLHRVQHFAGDRARIGDAILAGARQAAHAPRVQLTWTTGSTRPSLRRPRGWTIWP